MAEHIGVWATAEPINVRFKLLQKNMNLFILICMIVFLFYSVVYKKEKFNIENDDRCKKKGQIVSNFLPGTVCIGPGKKKRYKFI